MIFTFLDAVLLVTYFLLLFLSIFWLLVLFSPNLEQKKKKLVAFPFFSAIVPAYNEENSITATLQSLVNLEYPKDKIEIIVVNDGSKDGTKEIIELFMAQHPSHNIILLNQENRGKGNAMNNGLAIAKGEYFACLDADSLIAPQALKAMLPIFAQDHNVAAVCPLLKVKNPQSILQKVQWYEYVVNMFYKFLNAKLDCIHVTPGPFSVYKTNIIKDLGGYDENTITEDLEIAIRLQKHQYKIVQTFDTFVETMVPTTWKKLFRQRIRWYKGSVDNSIRYKNLIFNKKYGDFGIIRMPTIILSGIIAIVLVGTFFQALIAKAMVTFSYLQDINFDLLTLIRHFSLEMNILTWPFSRLFVAATLMGISFFIMIYSYKLIKERITNHGRTFVSLVTYLFIYGFFITAVWIYISFMLIGKKKNFWS
ncbi:MAG: glycosyltransferase [Nanoarchaeota archaeon]|nr:glycosyltransferase [Nanoarchaeota archaeon]